MGGMEQALLRLAAATFIGCLLGLDRELNRKPAGMRTHGLVALGAALVTVVSLGLTLSDGRQDPGAVTRTIQGVVAGVGFVGSGVILRDSDMKSVHGLTTAATIWIAAALGITCGAGYWPIVLGATALTLLVLEAGKRLERRLAAQPDAEKSATPIKTP